MNRLIVLLILCSIIILKAQNNIQNPRDTLRYQTDKIIVTAPRLNISLNKISFSTSIVQQDFIKVIPRSVSIDEPLKIVPGVKVDNQANGNRVHLSIRGIGILSERGIRGIKFLQDEIPINDPTGFAPDLFDIDFINVETIEVLRGPAASLYGGSASGGIVNIITKNSPDAPLCGNVSVNYGSNNFWKASGQFGGNIDKINYRLSYGRTMGDGYRVHTHFWGNTFYGKATYSPNDYFKLTPVIGYTNFYHENPEGINLQQYKDDPKQANPDAVPFNEYLQTERNTFGLNGLLLLNQQEFQFTGYSKRTKFTEANNHTFNYRTIITPGVSIQYSYKIGNNEDYLKNKISAGMDLQWQTIYEQRVVNDHTIPGNDLLSKEEIKQAGYGFFLLNNMSIGDSWNFTGSLRYDKINNELNDILKTGYDASGNADFSKVTGRIGVSYSVQKEVNLFANFGQGFLPPATEELAQNPDNFGGFNTHLTYSTSNGIDLGCRGNVFDNIYYDLTGFYLTTENDFDRYRITDSLRNQETFYRNIGSSERFGIEFYVKYTPVNQLKLQIAYTFSDFKYTNDEPIKIVMDDASILKYIENGNFLPNSPQHQFYFDAEYNFDFNLYLGLGIEAQSKTYIDGANIESEAAKGFTLLNARIGYLFNFSNYGLEFSLNAKNLTDQKYVAFTEPDPGGNAYQPGSGREFFGNLRLHF